MLKGKALQDFEQWYNFKIEPKTEMEFYAGDSSGYMTIDLEQFWKLPQTMQQGVLLQFFRERGIEIQVIMTTFKTDFKYVIYDWHSGLGKEITVFDFKDYSTTFTHAIDKACEVYGGEG